MPTLSDILTLVRELASEEVLGHCADEGDYCAFCHEPANGWMEIKHAPDCLWVRAVEVVKRLDAEEKDNK